MPRSGYLDSIVAHHRARAEASAPALDRQRLADEAAAAAPPRPFARAVATAGISVIAEVKRRSPSKGDLAPDLDPAALASAYQAGGASCLSVLTDGPHFGGSPADLVAAREACDLPVLRKDFTVCEADVLEARAMGADAVLLIVAALEPAELGEYRALAESLGMAALVEVHDSDELETALAAGASVIGVNQRDLRTFRVDEERAVSLAALIPPGVLRVAESGIATRSDVERLAAAGYDAVLVGESLVRSEDPASALARLLGAPDPAHTAREQLTCS